MSNPYALADKQLKILQKRMLKMAEKAKQRLLIDDFDELSVIQVVEQLYDDLYEDAKKKFIELYELKYIDVTLSVTHKQPKEDLIDQMFEMYVTEILTEPSNVTFYIYDTEVTRKRDRMKESILAVQGKTAKLAEVDKGIRIWSRMNVWYMDIVSQEAEIQAMKDAGVKKVQRHEMNDERTCIECMEEDKKIYPINKIPSTHPGCRRYFSIVK